MPKEISPIVTHTAIHNYRVDVDAQAIILDYSEGTTDEAGTYTPIRRLEKRIEGAEFEAHCNRQLRIENPSQNFLTTLYEVIKGVLYARIS